VGQCTPAPVRAHLAVTVCYGLHFLGPAWARRKVLACVRLNGAAPSVTMARPAASELAAAWTIMDHDYVFWLGDLNYRIDATLEDTLARAKSGTMEDMAYLLTVDQVRTPPTSIMTAHQQGPHIHHGGQACAPLHPPPPIRHPPTHACSGTRRCPCRHHSSHPCVPR
jgi:hypothetical protein